MPFYIRILSIHRFWYGRGSWNQSPIDTEGCQLNLGARVGESKVIWIFSKVEGHCSNSCIVQWSTVESLWPKQKLTLLINQYTYTAGMVCEILACGNNSERGNDLGFFCLLVTTFLHWNINIHLTNRKTLNSKMINFKEFQRLFPKLCPSTSLTFKAAEVFCDFLSKLQRKKAVVE